MSIDSSKIETKTELESKFRNHVKENKVIQNSLTDHASKFNDGMSALITEESISVLKEIDWDEEIGEAFFESAAPLHFSILVSVNTDPKFQMDALDVYTRMDSFLE